MNETHADPHIRCDACAAVCCRMTVLLMPGDLPPARYVAEDRHGMAAMAKGDDGWCVALDRQNMCCSIYPQRPLICREFAMGGADCRDERAGWASGVSSVD
ncbi:MAG: YkgJ family cysteine cluster protein [Xanthomonadaceae bacterium]|nr:YkgJ family cysteine cluster protein [Xanthomonadaceae bacterium]